VTCLIDVPVTAPGGFIGVDLGIANIATTSNGTRRSGKALNAVRHRRRELRTAGSLDRARPPQSAV
jgi:putative transposase